MCCRQLLAQLELCITVVNVGALVVNGRFRKLEVLAAVLHRPNHKPHVVQFVTMSERRPLAF